MVSKGGSLGDFCKWFCGVMDSTDIACLCESLSHTDIDGPVQILKANLKVEAVQRMSLCLIGKIMSCKAVNRGAFMRVIGRIWQVSRGFEVESVSGNMFSFHFQNEDDRQRVIWGSPWHFDDALLVLEKPVGKGLIESLKFNLAEFWIQIHQIPIICMSRKIGWFLGGLIGEVLEVDGGNTGEARGKFMRVRVRLEINKPLKRCLRVDIMGDGAKSLMILRYERLRSHCLKCGMVDHRMAECLVDEPIPVINGVAQPNFGIWMRASPPNYMNNTELREDIQKSIHHQQGLATGKGGSRSGKITEIHPMEEDRSNLGEQGKLVNKNSKSINVVIMDPKSDPNIDSGPDLCPSEISNVELVKECHGLEVENQVGSKTGPRIEISVLVQMKGKKKVVGAVGSVQKGEKKGRNWVRKVRSTEFGERVAKKDPATPPAKRKIGGDATEEDGNAARRKSTKIENHSSARMDDSRCEGREDSFQGTESQVVNQRSSVEMGCILGDDKDAQIVTVHRDNVAVFGGRCNANSASFVTRVALQGHYWPHIVHVFKWSLCL
ncbi:hypothetical protein EZV62_014226 [Acer yangbiense]|uniref:DUF4283 domain-containing protein n=1 Tax=Acer yangbiense TaxID=1000413 RepID=A0A5C7HRG8_9ROSI|nr:hypothetical protein EZV62_014226 [Acer yangbiense]